MNLVLRQCLKDNFRGYSGVSAPAMLPSARVCAGERTWRLPVEVLDAWQKVRKTCLLAGMLCKPKSLILFDFLRKKSLRC